MQEEIEISDADLIQFHSNANTTYQMAGGHQKAAMNKNARDEYAEEIARRGLRVSLKPGQFNGAGSY